jgi:hypothetical protein
VSESGKTSDGKSWQARSLLLPAPFAASQLGPAALKSGSDDSDSKSVGASLFALLFRAVLLLVLALALLPFSLLFRALTRRWTVEAFMGDQRTLWRARSRREAKAGVGAIAAALGRGESLQQPFAGLTPIT